MSVGLVGLLPLLIRLNCLGQLARNSDPQARDVRALMIQDSLSYEIQIQSQIYYICDVFNKSQRSLHQIIELWQVLVHLLQEVLVWALSNP